MSANHNRLAALSYAQGFTLWHYATTPGEDVLVPNFWDALAHILRQGDRVLCSGRGQCLDLACIAAGAPRTEMRVMAAPSAEPSKVAAA
jgi:hypothetical protein